jgi:hypothetical protein
MSGRMQGKVVIVTGGSLAKRTCGNAGTGCSRDPYAACWTTTGYR